MLLTVLNKNTNEFFLTKWFLDCINLSEDWIILPVMIPFIEKGRVITSVEDFISSFHKNHRRISNPTGKKEVDGLHECILVNKFVCEHKILDGKTCTYCKVPDPS
jgi:hypothetical protein